MTGGLSTWYNLVGVLSYEKTSFVYQDKRGFFCIPGKNLKEMIFNRTLNTIKKYFLSSLIFPEKKIYIQVEGSIPNATGTTIMRFI